MDSGGQHSVSPPSLIPPSPVSPDPRSRVTPRLYLAPLQGFTDVTFRNTFADYFKGFNLAVAPFISTTHGHRIKNTHFKGLLPEQNRKLPVIPQIMSNSPEDFIILARRLFDLGYPTLNWNLGCPFPAVVKKCRGSGMLPYPDRIDDFLNRVLSAIPNRLSIKTRIGRFKADEIHELMPVFNRYPLEELIIHPRTGEQRYEGTPDLTTFGECLDTSRHPVVFNGDINSMEIHRVLCTKFPTVQRWMIGRGAIADPFLPAALKNGHAPVSEKPGTFKKFHDALFDEYRRIFSGPSHVVERMKGFWGYFSRSFADPRKFVKKVHKCRKPEPYQDLVNRWFETEAQWAPDPQNWVSPYLRK